MVSIKGLIRKFEAVAKVAGSVEEIAGKVANDNKGILLSLNRDQLLLGRNTEGNLLTPDYLSDPYFKTPDAAKRYAKMKHGLEKEHSQRIANPTIYPNKPRNTPNLIVTGPFQDGMFITISGSTYNISSTYSETPDIVAKYNDLVFGHSPESKQFFFNNYILPEITKRLWHAAAVK